MNTHRHLFIAALAALVAACSSTSDRPDPNEIPELIDYPGPVEDELASLEIGGYLQEIDKRLRHWNTQKNEARTEEEDRVRRELEVDLERRVSEREMEILMELESGPPINRSVAAAALGFTGNPSLLGPLLTALSDPEPEVASNALLSLGQLELPQTPMAEICYLVRRGETARMRINAAYAMQRLVGVGADDPCIAESARLGLVDEEPGVVAQCAAVLGMLADETSLQALIDLLYAEAPLVARSAAASVSAIGRAHDEKKGEAARALANAFDRVGRAARPRVKKELIRLRGFDMGDDPELWIDWAYRLP